MTQDEIIEMAIQAELNLYVHDLTEKRYIEVIKTFANLVAAKEREACAKVVESIEAQCTEQEPLIGCVNHDCDKCKAQTQEPVAWIHNFIEGGISIGKRPADLNRHPDRWTALYKDPKPCPTCEALARTVMLDQTSHDTTPPQRTWVGLDEKDFSAINQSCLTKLQAATSAESILKEKNT
jgi:hypothetical protein